MKKNVIIMQKGPPPSNRWILGKMIGDFDFKLKIRLNL
jgi:hypothetical protein